jgi:membrane protein implicated in regulation of membrane protease activity
MSLVTWLIIAAFLIIVELGTMGLTSIWFAVGAFAAAITTQFTNNLWIQLIVFMVLSIILWIFTRPIAVKHLNLGKEKTNVDSLAGQKAIVTTTIDNLQATGQAKVNGLEWTARSADDSIINAGQTVVIKEVEGVKLIVEPIQA